MLLVQVQPAQLSPHGVMVAALDLGSSGRNGRKSSSLFVVTMLMWVQVAKGEDCKSYEYTPPAVRLRPSALETYKKYPTYVAKQCRLCYIFGTAVREAVEKIDKLDDSYCSIAQLVE